MERQPKILMVDDTPKNIKLLEAVLAPRGYALVAAESGAELAEWNRSLETRVRQQVDELERLGRLRRFLSPQLAELIISSGDESLLKSHRREIAVVFCDLRGFTPFSETAEPEEVVGILN